MALMAKTPILPDKHEDLNGEKKKACSVKLIIQLTLFGGCFLIIAYMYFGYNSKINIQRWSDFFRLMNSTKEKGRVSETSKWQPLSGNLLCFVNTALGDEGQEQITAIQKTWLTNCENAQFFSYKSFEKAGLSYRSIFKPLNIVQQTSFWELIYGFAYSYKHLSSQFNWYLNAQMDSYVFIQHLKKHLHKLDHQKPFVFVASQTKHDQNVLTIISNGAMRLFVERLYGSEEFCPFSGKSVEGFKRCFENIGIEVFDERQLKLHFMEFDNAKWVEHLDNELATSDNLLAISGCDVQVLYLIKLLTGDRNSVQTPINTSILCNQQ